ncbi:MAG TPA: hypothetical protein ENL04_04360 [Sulfuricurvum sp.]|nr:hypothetical protein [Sulfuricurvum sp.]
MQPVNNIQKQGMSKKQAKKMQKMVNALQKEMADTVYETMKEAGKPLDVNDIVTAYPDNERRKSCKDDNELKLHISMGLGKLIQDGKVKELPKTADGKFLLEII